MIMDFDAKAVDFCRYRLFWVLQNSRKKVFKTQKKNKLIDTTAVGPGDYLNMLDEAEKSVRTKDKAFMQAAALAGISADVKAMKEETDEADKIIYEELQKMAIEYINKARTGLSKVKGMARKPGESEYDDLSDEYFNIISINVKAGKSVCMGSKDFSGSEISGAHGESTGKGMVGGHLYSIHDTQIVDGKKMVLMRNPWASYTVKYIEKNNTLEAKAEEHEAGGMFWIEMNHLMNYIGDIDIS